MADKMKRHVDSAKWAAAHGKNTANYTFHIGNLANQLYQYAAGMGDNPYGGGDYPAIIEALNAVQIAMGRQPFEAGGLRGTGREVGSAEYVAGPGAGTKIDPAFGKDVIEPEKGGLRPKEPYRGGGAARMAPPIARRTPRPVPAEGFDPTGSQRAGAGYGAARAAAARARAARAAGAGGRRVASDKQDRILKRAYAFKKLISAIKK
jgi:hypothetical protein